MFQAEGTAVQWPCGRKRFPSSWNSGCNLLKADATMGSRKFLGSIRKISQVGQADASGVASQKDELSRVHGALSIFPRLLCPEADMTP